MPSQCSCKHWGQRSRWFWFSLATKIWKFVDELSNEEVLFGDIKACKGCNYILHDLSNVNKTVSVQYWIGRSTTQEQWTTCQDYLWDREHLVIGLRLNRRTNSSRVTWQVQQTTLIDTARIAKVQRASRVPRRINFHEYSGLAHYVSPSWAKWESIRCC